MRTQISQRRADELQATDFEVVLGYMSGGCAGFLRESTSVASTNHLPIAHCPVMHIGLRAFSVFALYC